MIDFMIIFGVGGTFAAGPVLLLQLCLWLIMSKTLQRKKLSKANLTWLFIPFAGLIAAYWVACKEEAA